MAADESTLTADASDIVSVLNLSVSTLSHNVCWNFSVSSRSRHCLITFVGIRRSRHCLTMFFFGIPRSFLGLDTVSQRFFWNSSVSSRSRHCLTTFFGIPRSLLCKLGTCTEARLLSSGNFSTSSCLLSIITRLLTKLTVKKCRNHGRL